MSKETPDKPLEEYTEEELKQIFLDIFFWVAANRPEWLQEAIDIRRKQLAEAGITVET